MASAKIFRINYKSDFILTLESDAGWMTPFCIKFWTGAPSQAYYVGWDGETYNHCSFDPSEPTKLQVQFDDHHLPIGDLKYQVAYHFTVDDFPNDTEDEVINPANITTEIDGETYQVMLDFTGETAPEIQFALPAYANEAQRIANEQQRIAAETQRIDNEETRIANEQTRINQEQTRQQNEQQRINQEQARVQEYAQLKADAVAATGAANDAATLAQQKAEYAQQQGGYAKEQGDYAKNQGDYAKEQGDTALADHQRAESDHGIAVDDHTTAASDHSRAESDHTTAAADHTQAGNDHTRAESDHATAAADHTQAGQDHTTAASDHSRAESDHTTAAADHTQAGQDHTTAASDHTQAGNDHTRAESDHGIAAADHTQAGNDHTRAESDHTRAESDHAAVEVYVDSLGAFDISAYHATGGVLAKYADLTAALGTNGANIPEGIRKGGMSVKYVQTSDNNYVQARCMADEFTTDTTQWAIAEEGVYVENPEFFYVKTDAEGKILWAIKTDGSIYYGVGVPQQVIDYIEKKIADLSLDEYEDIVAFLDDLITGDKTLAELLNEKVDKEEGKSLIDAEYANGVRYIENPEFAGVWLDGENKILFGVEQDGNFLFGCGVPKQVKEYIEQKIGELSLDEYESIVAFIGDYLNNTTLEELLSKKVDGEYVENPEFIEAKVDAEDKVLEGIQTDGTKVIGGDIKILGNMEVSGVSYKVIENPEYLAAWIDAEGKVIFGLKADGKTYVGDADFLNDIDDIKVFLRNITDKNIDWDALTSFNAIENSEFIEVELDAEDKVLGGRKTDGTKFENNDVELNSNATVGGSLGVGGVVIKNLEDPEGRLEIATDSENKIISYRKDNGTKVENVGFEAPVINTNSLNLTEQGMADFQQALKDAGFQPGGSGDYTDKDSMYIPEPRLAYLNIITDFNLVNLTKTSDVKCEVEFFDGAGNYFKKWMILNGQGRSSLSFPKKGLGADFFNEDPNSEDFDEDNVFSMKFGDWVYQDSFHIKSYYTDWPRCTSPVVYKLTDEVVRTRGVMKDRPYKKYYVDAYSDAANANTQSDLDKNMETGARCFPDGFPVIVYQNGEFWGVNSWQLKKHRDNYMLNKKKDSNIHLDGDMGTLHYTPDIAPQPYVPFWLWNGNINWAAYCSGFAGIETRNPKNLYCVDGKKYNADTHDAEIITTAIAEEWIAAGKIIPTDKSIESIARKELADDGITDPTPEQLADAISKVEGYFTTTGKVRKSIEDLTTYVPTIRQMATIETNNGDIMIGAFGGDYDASKNFGKGIWVVSEERNYMSIHSSNTGNPVTDTNNWVDITDALADVKETIEDMFDLDTFIDFIVIGNVVGNNDAWDNNGQIVTWGKLSGSSRLNWSVNMYDCDITFGCQWNGIAASAANNLRLGSTYPLYKIFWNYYYDELKARYHELRDKGVFDADHITQLFRSWMDRVGYDNYAKEFKKWPESPCFRDGSKTYTHNPTTGGFYGSIERIYLWIKKRIQYMDAADFFDYNQN